MPSEPDFLLSVYLRGAADGLSIVAPYDDPVYKSKRSATQILAPGSGNPNREAIPLQAASGNTPAFGMPKVLQPLKGLYDDGSLAFVHATGSMDKTRSHFEQQSLMERGITNTSIPSAGSGVWGRYLSTTDPVGTGSLRAVSITSNLPRILKGGLATAPTPDPANFGFPGAPLTADVRRDALAHMYGGFGPPLRQPFANVLTTIDEMQAIDWDGYTPAPGVTYPNTVFGVAAMRAAQMAKELPSMEVVHIDKGGWDTHYAQGVFGGLMFNELNDLSQSLEAFLRDMEVHGRKVIVVAVTEFGRTLKENSSSGTDHGRGGVAIVAGDGVNGGQVVSDWPGLSPNKLDDGDMAVTIDTRDIFGEIMQDRLNHPDINDVLTDGTYTYTDRGLMTDA